MAEVNCIWPPEGISDRGSSSRNVESSNIFYEIQKVRRIWIQLQWRGIRVKVYCIWWTVEIVDRGSSLHGSRDRSDKYNHRGISGKCGFVYMSAVGRWRAEDLVG